MTGSDTGSVPSYYPNQYRLIVDRTLKDKFYWDFNQHAHIFIHGNEFDKVLGNIVAIMSRGHRWVWTHRRTGVVPLTRRHLHVITLHMVNEYCHKQPSYSSINIQKNNALVQCSVNSFFILVFWCHMASWNSVNGGSNYGLLFDSSMPLPEPAYCHAHREYFSQICIKFQVCSTIKMFPYPNLPRQYISRDYWFSSSSRIMNMVLRILIVA